MSAIPLKELITLTDEEIIKRNSEEANKYIKIRDALKSESNDTKPEGFKVSDPVNISKPEGFKVEDRTKPTTTTTTKPKRKCTEKQLAALAAGRAKNPRLLKKLNQETETKK